MKRQKLPFRIGTTSYIYPDDILPNVHKLKGKVEDIELVLFEVNNVGNIPQQADLQELKRISNKWNLTYTVHLPLDINLGSAIADKRKWSVEKAGLLIERLAMLNPYAYILHLNLSKRAEGNIKLWQGRINQSLKEMAGFKFARPQDIVVENLNYPFGYVDALVLKNGFSICVDIGHLITAGIDPLKHLKKYIGMTRVIHLHGVNGCQDHTSLRYFDAALIRRIIQFLKHNNYNGVLTLEMFSQTDFKESMDIIIREGGDKR